MCNETFEKKKWLFKELIQKKRWEDIKESYLCCEMGGREEWEKEGIRKLQGKESDASEEEYGGNMLVHEG